MKNARFRRQEQAFVVEGWKMVAEALEHHLVKEIYLSEHAGHEYRRRLAHGELTVPGNDVMVETVSEQCFRAVADTVAPQGILGNYDADSRGGRNVCIDPLQRVCRSF